MCTIGKILYYDKWYFCRYENNKLEILRAECEMLDLVKNAKVKFANSIVINFFEDDSICFF